MSERTQERHLYFLPAEISPLERLTFPARRWIPPYGPALGLAPNAKQIHQANGQPQPSVPLKSAQRSGQTHYIDYSEQHQAQYASVNRSTSTRVTATSHNHNTTAQQAYHSHRIPVNHTPTFPTRSRGNQVVATHQADNYPSAPSSLSQFQYPTRPPAQNSKITSAGRTPPWWQHPSLYSNMTEQTLGQKAQHQAPRIESTVNAGQNDSSDVSTARSAARKTQNKRKAVNMLKSIEDDEQADASAAVEEDTGSAQQGESLATDMQMEGGEKNIHATATKFAPVDLPLRPSPKKGQSSTTQGLEDDTAADQPPPAATQQETTTRALTGAIKQVRFAENPVEWMKEVSRHPKAYYGSSKTPVNWDAPIEEDEEEVPLESVQVGGRTLRKRKK